MLGHDLAGYRRGLVMPATPPGTTVFGQQNSALLAGKAGQIGHGNRLRPAGDAYFDVPAAFDGSTGIRILIDDMVFGHLVMVCRSFNTGIESQVREDLETIQDLLAHQVGDDDGIFTLDDQVRAT
jgi:hypothetical protein